MPTYTINGQEIEFEKEPTEQDIDEVAKQLAPSPADQIEKTEKVRLEQDIAEDEAAHPYRTAINKTAKTFTHDVANIGAHFSNQYLANAPRSLSTYAEGQGQRPEGLRGYMQEAYANPEAETVAGDKLAKAAGFVGGVLSPLNKLGFSLAGKGRLAAAAATGAVQGGLYAPTENPYDMGQRTTQAGIGALIGGAAGAAPNVAGFIRKNMAGFTNETANAIKRLGFDKVTRVMQKGSDYVARVIAPQAREKILQHVVNAGQRSKVVLEDLGFKPDEIDSLLSIAPKRLKELKSDISASWYLTKEQLKKKTQQTGQAIGELRRLAMENGNTVRVNYPYQALQKELQSAGVIDLTGAPLSDLNLADGQTKALYQVFSDLRDRVGKKSEISMGQLKNYVDRLESAWKTDGAKNYIIRRAVRSFRGAEEKLLRPIALLRRVDSRKLMRGYYENKTLEELGDTLNRVINDSAEGMQLSQTLSRLKNPMMTLNRDRYKNIYGQGLIDDLDAFSAGQEIEAKALGSGWNIVGQLGKFATEAGWRARDMGRGLANAVTANPLGQQAVSEASDLMKPRIPSLKGLTIKDTSGSNFGTRKQIRDLGRLREELARYRTAGDKEGVAMIQDEIDRLSMKPSQKKTLKGTLGSDYSVEGKEGEGWVVQGLGGERVQASLIDTSYNKPNSVYIETIKSHAPGAGRKLVEQLKNKFSTIYLDATTEKGAQMAKDLGFKKVGGQEKGAISMNKYGSWEWSKGGAALLAVGATADSANAEQKVNMNKVFKIESNGNPKAHNKSEDARGLGQVRPAVLADWNKTHPKEKHTPQDLFDAATNKKIADWYMNEEIPRMIKAYKKEDTARNRIVAYNAGIGYIRYNKPIPLRTKKYLAKYEGAKNEEKKK